MFEKDNDTVQRGSEKRSSSMFFFAVVTFLFACFFIFKMQDKRYASYEEEPVDQVQEDYTSAPPKQNHYDYKESIILDAPPMPKASPSFTIEDAYASVPKEYTPFLASRTSINHEESLYLQELFRMTDIGVRSRVMLQLSLYNNQALMDYDSYRAEMKTAFEFFESTTPPQRLEEVASLIHQALTLQARYFEEWSGVEESQRQQFGNGMTRDKSVKTSSKALIRAYQILMGLYKSESVYTKRSFYNHLCALDFI